MTEGYTSRDNVSSPVWYKGCDTITMLDGGTTEATDIQVLNGIIGTIVLVLPDSTNGVTCTLAVKDENGRTLYSAAGLADNTTHVKTGVDILVAGATTISLTASADPGSDWAGTVELYGV